ncbi:natural resistance-associated macrophage protein-domain-containing protein [Xylariaceae sp. FL0016]|nr:natural resistance-associated macrophage protein-domain-containing protein [Xylariaceae sp. FL0016]
MNQTSRTDEPYEGDDGKNQSPNALSNDLITNQDLNGIVNAREQRGSDIGNADESDRPVTEDVPPLVDKGRDRTQPNSASTTHAGRSPGLGASESSAQPSDQAKDGSAASRPAMFAGVESSPHGGSGRGGPLHRRLLHTIVTFGKFVGPGFLVAVAYIDPGNYATDISAGAENKFRLLFVILMSNLFAVVLQCLSVKLGTVTGLNLSQACRTFLPRWLNYFLYFMAEVAIIATDIAEVIGTAIGLNLLIPQLPLVAGCAISILDVMVILFFYRPHGPMKGLRCFEFFVMALVVAVVICFCIQLSMIENTTAGEVFRGYIPNDSITKPNALFQACGILGATVMPHSLFLGSGIVQSRLKDYDAKCGLLPADSPITIEEEKAGVKTYYIPSLSAIKHSLKYSYTEVTLSLVTFALFVNSAILIVAGASLYSNPNALEADIFGIHALLSQTLSRAAGTIFALALLFSGISAGIVCTITGQMICEGALRWQMKPWLRRLVTRSISITPSIIIAGAAGREKLNDALNGSQVALSVVLPFVSAPLIWFTCFNKYMTAQSGPARYKTEGRDSFSFGSQGTDPSSRGDDEEMRPGDRAAASDTLVRMGNSWWVCCLTVAIWLVIVVMNIANLVLLGLGDA